MEINNQQDILRALDTDPAFREAVRRHLLTDDLINLPEKFAAFATSQQAFNQSLREDVQSERTCKESRRATHRRRCRRPQRQRRRTRRLGPS